MSNRRVTLENYRDEANQLKAEAILLVDQLKGSTKRKLSNDVNLAWIKNDTDELKRLIRDLHAQVETSNSVAAD